MQTQINLDFVSLTEEINFVNLDTDKSVD